MQAQGQPYNQQNWEFAGYRGGKAPITLADANFYDVTRYGADSLGSKDSSISIQAAVDEAAKSGGGTVYLPAGRYLLKLPINITASNIALKGAQKDKTTVVIPLPLSKVLPKPYLYDGGLFSHYCWQDGFLRISGNYNKSAPDNISSDTFLARALYGTAGSSSILVDSSEKLQVGSWVRLYLSDPPFGPLKGSLVSELYGGHVANTSCSTLMGKSTCFGELDGRQYLFHWASKIISINGMAVGLERSLPFSIREEWSPELHNFPAGTFIQDSGIENLRIEFAWSPLQPHHLDLGYNAIEVKSAFNAWVRNVTTINADHGVLVLRSFSVLVSGINTFVSKKRGGSRADNGHIGIGVIGSTDVLVENFNITAPLMHDITVVQTTLAHFRHGTGANLNLDAHGLAPFGTLYNDMYLGAGSRPFTAGGDMQQGFPVGAFTTYYNLRSANPAPITIRNTTKRGKCTYSGNYVSYIGRFSAAWEDCHTSFVTRIREPLPSDFFVYKKQRNVTS